MKRSFLLKVRNNFIKTMFLLTALIFFHSVHAEGGEVNLVMKNLPQYVYDGMIIGSGKIKYEDPHRGFLIIPKGGNIKEVNGLYTVSGDNNPVHSMIFRLNDNAWTVEDKKNEGVMLMTADDEVSFMILSGGDQKLLPDIYSISLDIKVLKE